MDKDIVMQNSEILYIYDAKLCNPNGDPDEENRPRMDYEKDINLVSDVRLKRYIRDFAEDEGMLIYVRKIDGKSITPEDSVKSIPNDTDVLDAFIDVRLFGATMPIKSETKTFIGPVQFNWGYSLNKVELLEASITSHFVSDKSNTQGAIGKDYRVKYSFIAFSGIVSAKRAKFTKLSVQDVKFLDRAMRYAIALQATRSKIGQYPRLYLRIEYKDDKTFLGDMRGYIKLVELVENPRDIKDVELDITELIGLFEKNKGVISKIYYFADDNLAFVKEGVNVLLEEALSKFELQKVE